MPDRLIPSIDGKRGGFLLIIGIGWLTIGLSYVLGPRTESRQAGFSWLPSWLDANELGWAWVAAGLTAIIAALVSKRWKWVESLAFGALIAPTAIWTAVFTIAQTLGEHPYGWISAVSYGIFTAVIYHCSSWPNPVRRAEEPSA